MTRQCPRAGKHTVLGHLFLHPHQSSVQPPGDWEPLPVVVAEVRAVSLGPELAGAHAVWHLLQRPVGCHPTREPSPSISVCMSQKRQNYTLEWEPTLRFC